MEMLFGNGRAYFKYKDLRKEIELNGKREFYAMEEIEEAVKGIFGYHIVGRVHQSKTKELFNIDEDPYIYVVSTEFENPIFCSVNGYLVYY